MINYYICSGGDGSVYMITCSTKELADYLDEIQDEPWGEPSSGTIDADYCSGGPDMTEIKYLVELVNESKDYEGFLKLFFKDLPLLKYSISQEVRNKKYYYISIYYNDSIVDKLFTSDVEKTLSRFKFLLDKDPIKEL